HLGEAYRRAGRHQEALSSCGKGHAVAEALVKDHPKERAYQRELGVSCCGLGNGHRDRGELELALSWYDRAAGQFQGLTPASGEELYLVAAEVAALAGGGKGEAGGASEEQARRRRAADKAMELLRLAVLRGFADARAVKEGAALAPLRSRDDFKALLADLEAKAKTAARGKPGG